MPMSVTLSTKNHLTWDKKAEERPVASLRLWYVRLWQSPYSAGCASGTAVPISSRSTTAAPSGGWVSGAEVPWV